MGLKQHFNIVPIGIMKAVEGLAILGLICGAASLPTYAQVVTATIGVCVTQTQCRPVSVAVNPVTNQIYVVTQSTNNVTVIDGATDNTTTLAAGTNPHSVNPTTNQIYVTNSQGSDVTVLNEGVDPDRRCPSDYLHQSRVTR